MFQVDALESVSLALIAYFGVRRRSAAHDLDIQELAMEPRSPSDMAELTFLALQLEQETFIFCSGSDPP